MKTRFRLSVFYFSIMLFVISFLYALSTEHDIALGAEKNNLLEKWKKAVINLECVSDKISPETLSKISAELKSKFQKGEINGGQLNQALEELNRKHSEGLQKVRAFGTAVFIEHDQRRYLITARHVLYNRFVGPVRGREPIYYLIYSVPSLDNLLSPNPDPRLFLMNLEAGLQKMRSYTFSDESIDLAIISLDSSMLALPRRAGSLLSLGHVPITLNDISDGPSLEGVDVFTVGYPVTTSTIAKRRIKPWRTSIFSLPTFSFGKTAMLHQRLTYFKCDVRAYPGASGSPIVENGKLVGIVTKQSMYPSEILSTQDGKKQKLIALTRVPFLQATKAKYIKELLRIQIEKDNLSSVLK